MIALSTVHTEKRINAWFFLFIYQFSSWVWFLISSKGCVGSVLFCFILKIYVHLNIGILFQVNAVVFTCWPQIFHHFAGRLGKGDSFRLFHGSQPLLTQPRIFNSVLFIWYEEQVLVYLGHFMSQTWNQLFIMLFLFLEVTNDILTSQSGFNSLFLATDWPLFPCAFSGQR